MQKVMKLFTLFVLFLCCCIPEIFSQTFSQATVSDSLRNTIPADFSSDPIYHTHLKNHELTSFVQVMLIVDPSIDSIRIYNGTVTIWGDYRKGFICEGPYEAIYTKYHDIYSSLFSFPEVKEVSVLDCWDNCRNITYLPLKSKEICVPVEDAVFYRRWYISGLDYYNILGDERVWSKEYYNERNEFNAHILDLMLCGPVNVNYLKQTNDYIYFSDPYLDLEPHEREHYLDMLLSWESPDGLFWLFCDSSTCRIERARDIDVSLYIDECTGSSRGYIEGGGDYLISYFDGLNEGVIDIMTSFHDLLYADNTFEFSGQSYVLSAFGDYKGDEYYNAKNVRIRFTNIDTGESQIIAAIPEMEFTSPHVLFIGDLDGDGKPDLLLQQGHNYEFYEAVLYLSSTAKEGELLKRAGSHSMWRDC